MIKYFSILFLYLFSNNSFAQEIKSIYLFKKEINNKNELTYRELDSLVIYKNGEYFRKTIYMNHEIIQDESSGNWSKNNGKVKLKINLKNEYARKDNPYCSPERLYKIRANKLIPVSGFQCELKTHKLKLVFDKK